MPTGDASAPSIAIEPLQTGSGARFAALFGAFQHRLEDRLDRERDQLALWLPVGLGLGVAAWFALPDRSGWTAFLLLAGGGMLASLALAPGTRWGRALAIFWLAATIGCLNIWAKADRVAAPRLERARLAEFSAVVEAVQTLPAEQ